MNAAYVTVDVFTSVRFAGNPLAVFPDARGLTDDDMQKIAAEFSYSEVTFVLPPDDPANTARVRIFTPTMEIPFAGHPNVGTAFVLGRQAEIFGRAVGDTLRFEERAGLVDVKLVRDGGVVTGAAIRAPRELAVGHAVPDDMVARAASIAPGTIRHSTHAPRFASVGLPFVLAEVDGLETLGSARPNLAAFKDAAAIVAGQGNHDFSLFLYVRSLERPWEIRARMFAPLDNVIEDPATGSASAALGAYLASLLPDDHRTLAITIEQGVEMGRRSVIRLAVTKVDGHVADVVISGECVDVMQGVIRV